MLATARAKGTELGCVPVLPGGGAALAVLAAAIGARAVVEIGTGAGVGSVWLLRGMRPDGVLTTIDVEPEHHRAARETFAEAGVASNRVRLISGRALDVLPRLTDGAYDLVLLDADKVEYGAYLEQALRLLRPGGVLAVDNALWHDRVADPAQRDEATTAVREMGKAVRDHEDLIPAMLPCGDGLLLAVKRSARSGGRGRRGPARARGGRSGNRRPPRSTHTGRHRRAGCCAGPTGSRRWWGAGCWWGSRTWTTPARSAARSSSAGRCWRWRTASSSSSGRATSSPPCCPRTPTPTSPRPPAGTRCAARARSWRTPTS